MFLRRRPARAIRAAPNNMARKLSFALIAAALALCAFCSVHAAQTQTPAPAAAKKHLLFIGEEHGYRHEAVSHAMATIERLGRETGYWDTVLRTDTEILTKKKLDYNAKNLNDFDAV